MGYSVQPRDRIFGKHHGFLSFAKNMGKNIGKKIRKNLSGKYSQKLHKTLFEQTKQSAVDAFKTASKRIIQKQQKQFMIWFVTKLLIELQNVQKLLNKIIQKKLQMSTIEKYLKKDIYFQKKDRNY